MYYTRHKTHLIDTRHISSRDMWTWDPQVKIPCHKHVSSGTQALVRTLVARGERKPSVKIRLVTEIKTAGTSISKDIGVMRWTLPIRGGSKDA